MTVVRLPPLHPGQRIIHESKARFRVVTCGRRFGKTFYAGYEALVCALAGGKVWWVGPNAKQTRIAWRLLTRMVRLIPGIHVMKSELRIEFVGGGFIEIKSGESEESLLGEGLDLVVVDEAALLKEEVWARAIRPTLSDRLGKALLISSPRGRNWFWAAFAKGQDPEQENWASFQMPTSANPFIAASEIEEAKRDLPIDIFRQEYEAEFLDKAGAVFQGVDDCVGRDYLEVPEPGHRYVLGLDIARKHDWTVCLVIDASTYPKRVVQLVRFQKLSWDHQVERIRTVVDRFGVVGIAADATGVGDPIVMQLQREMPLPVVGVTFSSRVKTEFVENLSLGFERGMLELPPDDLLLNELKAYEATPLPSGSVRYSAPHGQHDDCVMALALAFAVAGGMRSETEAVLDGFRQEIVEYHDPVRISRY